MGIPIGLIQSAYSGTVIETWMSKETFETCGQDYDGMKHNKYKIMWFINH